MGFIGVWDLFVGALSVGLAAPVIKRLVDSQLPTRWLVIMTTVFDDTDALLTSCVEQGLIKEPLAALFHSQIESLRQRAVVARLRALGAKDYYEDFKNMCKGLSFVIHKVCNEVRVLRAEISTTSLRERERLAAEHRHTGGVSPVANRDIACAPPPTMDATQSSGAAVASNPPAITTSGVESSGTAPPAQMQQHAGALEHSSANPPPAELTASHHVDAHSSASTRPTKGWQQGALLSRAHAQLLARFVRKVRARDDLRSSQRHAQDETTIELSDASSVTLVGDADESEWETDHEDDPQQADPCMPLTDAVEA